MIKHTQKIYLLFAALHTHAHLFCNIKRCPPSPTGIFGYTLTITINITKHTDKMTYIYIHTKRFIMIIIRNKNTFFFLFTMG